MKKSNKITIRPVVPDDYLETENIIREAFWDVYRPGCSEHLIIHKLRKTTAFINELDLVACDEGRIVGVVVCPKAKVKNNQCQEFTVLSLIIGVLPFYQNNKIGSLLMQKIIKKAQALGFKGIILFGNPTYYQRFGFRNAKEYNIQTAEGENLDPFMALELSKGSLEAIEGRFYEDSIYHVEDDELNLFDARFPYKEKHITSTQLK